MTTTHTLPSGHILKTSSPKTYAVITVQPQHAETGTYKPERLVTELRTDSKDMAVGNFRTSPLLHPMFIVEYATGKIIKSNSAYDKLCAPVPATEEILEVAPNDTLRRGRKLRAVAPATKAIAPDAAKIVARKDAKAAKRAEKVAKVAKSCACGCGELTAGGDFRIGHDAKLKSQLVKTAMDATTPGPQMAAALELDRRGWMKFLEKAQQVAQRTPVQVKERKIARYEDRSAEIAKRLARLDDMKKAARLVKDMFSPALIVTQDNAQLILNSREDELVAMYKAQEIAKAVTTVKSR
jgi:hypothetical protein